MIPENNDELSNVAPAIDDEVEDLNDGVAADVPVVAPTVATDKEILRAFVEPSLFPLLLEVYTARGSNAANLREDIELARIQYKTLVAAEKKPQLPSKKSKWQTSGRKKSYVDRVYKKPS
jgi:hypothetical protein